MKRIVTESGTNVVRYVIDTIYAIIMFILAARFILKLFEVGNANALVDFIYRVGSVFIFPFRGIVDSFKIGDNLTFESSTMIAIIIITLLYWLVIGIFPRSRVTTITQNEFME